MGPLTQQHRAKAYDYLILMPLTLLLASVISVNSNHMGSVCLLAMTWSNTLNIAVNHKLISWGKRSAVSCFTCSCLYRCVLNEEKNSMFCLLSLFVLNSLPLLDCTHTGRNAGIKITLVAILRFFTPG